MRIVALEEHFSLPSVQGRARFYGFQAMPALPTMRPMPLVVRRIAEKIKDLGAAQFGDIDRAGITVQVVSKAGNHMGPSADMFEGAEAVAFARDFNDTAHREIAQYPDRFAAFAHLPDDVPEARRTSLSVPSGARDQGRFDQWHRQRCIP